MNNEQLIGDVYRKIEREQKLIEGANSMRHSTDNPSLQQRLDAKIREGRKNIGYLEETMRELQLREIGQGHGAEGRSGGGAVGGDGASALAPSSHAAALPTYYSHPDRLGAPTLPPKAPDGRYGTDQTAYDTGSGGYSQLSGGHGAMPPRAPYGPAPPTLTPKARPNYSKLGKEASPYRRVGQTWGETAQ